mgnify:CR=1 FL=1
MAKKRRTRKDKKTAKHQFTVSWEPSTKKPSRHDSVKGQFNSNSNTKSKARATRKKANTTAKDTSHARIKRDIAKSILFASLILCLEVVVYLIQG